MSDHSGWNVYDNIVDVHVFPEDDQIGHTLDEDCVCGPSAECYERWLYIHHSIDGREKYG